MGLKEERRINENENVWEEAKGKRGEGCVMGGWYGYGNYHILLFQGVGRVFKIENMDNYRSCTVSHEKALPSTHQPDESANEVAIASQPMGTRRSSQNGPSTAHQNTE
jgi:hypothetical protein